MITFILIGIIAAIVLMQLEDSEVQEALAIFEDVKNRFRDAC